MPFDNKGKLNLGIFPKFDGNSLAKQGLKLGLL